MPERYKKFYNQYKNKLFSYLVYLSGDTEISKDIMQESFTRHFQHYSDDSAASPALLFTIARNALIDHHRVQNRFKDGSDFIEKATGDEEKNILVREEYRRVRQLIARLSHTEQEALTLAVGGMAYKDIAAVTGTSESNIKVRVHRARIKLRQLLMEEEVS